MKQLKDYLHLYLGCECEVNTELKTFRGRLTGFVDFDNEKEYCFRVQVLPETWHWYEYKEIKPILRPLTDMTEEEKGLLKINIFQAACIDRINNDVMWTFEQVKILLSKHFDLFGLHEAGLAIDKTTLTK